MKMFTRLMFLSSLALFAGGVLAVLFPDAPQMGMLSVPVFGLSKRWKKKWRRLTKSLKKLAGPLAAGFVGGIGGGIVQDMLSDDGTEQPQQAPGQTIVVAGGQPTPSPFSGTKGLLTAAERGGIFSVPIIGPIFNFLFPKMRV